MLSPNEEAQIISQGHAGILPVGAAGLATQPFAQTIDRRLAYSSVLAPTSGTLTMSGIWLPAGAKVTGITFVSGSTAESGGSHLWYALYTKDLVLLAQSTDDTGATSFAANTAFRKALTAPVTLPYTGLYYVGFCCVGTVPTLCNATLGNVNTAGNIAGMTPIVCGTSNTGLNTGTAPNPCNALAAAVLCLYAFVD